MYSASGPVKVTVVMTLYNKGPYVEEALRSVLTGTFTDLEVVVVDDASTDDGPAKVRAIADPRVVFLASAVNTGRAAAANRGFRAARGTYIAILDADDVSHPERIARQVAFLDARPEVGVVGTAYAVLGDRSKVAQWPPMDPDCRAQLLFGDPVIYGTVMFRRSVMETHGLHCDEQWLTPGMDYLFMASFAPHTQYANLPEALLHYRMGENNMRHARDPLTDKAAIIRAIFQFYGLPLTEARLDLQLALHGLFRVRFDAGRVRGLWHWIHELEEWNRAKGHFPPDLFAAELHRRWQRLFHRFADNDLGAALTHMGLAGQWPMARLMYLAKTTVNRWTGSKR